MVILLLIEITEEIMAEAANYRIVVRGRLDRRWTDWLGGLTITYDDVNTVLSGFIVDQAALHGILQKIRDMNLPLVSISQIEEDIS